MQDVIPNVFVTGRTSILRLTNFLEVDSNKPASDIKFVCLNEACTVLQDLQRLTSAFKNKASRVVSRLAAKLLT